jgi:serine/threonine protein kinase
MSMIGKSLVHYEITSEIGRGGMGEVYQAKDTKLGRDVAIKVLPEEFALDKDRVARFQREAKLLASLNHPNIAAIHGLEESEGIHFLVMELIEGETLKDRIKTGPIPVEEALKLALQMAEALEAAHEKGVIHRDLKPANIKVTPDGKAKILDFGLAKAYVGDQDKISLADSPTISAAATQQGVILGTAAYMSPEQARGKPVDKRADIWAFAVVLYEMLTGKSAFSGTDVTDTLAAVIRSEPEWDSLPKNLHWRLREVLERCLEKEAKDRYGSISDARVDIQKALADPSGIFTQPISTVEPRGKLRSILSWVVAAVILTSLIVGAVVWKLKPPEPRHVSRFYYDVPSGREFSNPLSPFFKVAPNGRQFVYCTTKGLYLQSIDELDAKLIAGTVDEEPSDPCFSPDGQWICYWSMAHEKLKKIPINGGAPIALADIDNSSGPRWCDDNTILYGSLLSGIRRISADGGTPEVIIGQEGEHLISPQMLPDGKSVLFTKHEWDSGALQAVVESLETGERKVLVEGAVGAQYYPTGHLIYSIENDIFAAPFDPNKLEITGGQVPLLEDVFTFASARRHYDISDSGTLLYIPEPIAATTTSLAQRTLVWVDRDGKEEAIPAQPGAYGLPRISPDGTKVALNAVTGDNNDVWVWDFARNTMTRLTFDDADEGCPLWTPDGKRIVFRSGQGVYWKAADGTGEVENLYSGPRQIFFPWSWSNDGKTMALWVLNVGVTAQGFGFEVGAISMEGDQEYRPLLEEKYIETLPRISPDGRWLAYTSDESGQVEIYVRPFPEVESGGRWQVSTNGGRGPLWSANGRELFYQSDEGVMVVDVDAEPTFRPGNPKILFQGTYYSNFLMEAPVTHWDIHPDGKKFLMIKQPQTTVAESSAGIPHKIIIVTNWFEELKQRVPVD